MWKIGGSGGPSTVGAVDLVDATRAVRRFFAVGGCRALTARGISAGGAPGRTRTCDLEISAVRLGSSIVSGRYWLLPG
ncbi:hypothetical protein AB0F91_45340, partial [Amycolatopsis sp. NPDC023774]|uniref:hypothetical protein n=1 Tax=Amycolatopsis sp. NPDC023774 TaxID=3155015 RepID=UPI0033D5693B